MIRKILQVVLFLLAGNNSLYAQEKKNELVAYFMGVEEIDSKECYLFQDDNYKQYQFTECNKVVFEKLDLNNTELYGEKFKVIWVSLIEKEEDIKDLSSKKILSLELLK